MPINSTRKLFLSESRKMWKYLSLNFLADIETVCCSLKKVPLEVQCLFYVPCFGIAWQLKNSPFLPWKQQFCESVLVVSFYFVLFQEEFLFTLLSVKGVCLRRWTKNISYLGTPDRGHSLMVALRFWGKHKRWLCQMSLKAEEKLFTAYGVWQAFQGCLCIP